MAKEKLGLQTRLELNDGKTIPQLGLGVYQSPPGEGTYNSVRAALDAGYRHIDTAAIYGNERDVGRAIRESGLPRKEIFVATKLWNSSQGYGSAKQAFAESLRKLDLDYIDLYLLHWPVPAKRLESWKALEELKKEGLAKSIGVSNFLVRHLEELLENSEQVPAVNQVELSPFLFQKSVIEFCRKKNIIVEAYSPLTRGEKLTDKNLMALAKKYKKTPAQILLRWSLQEGLVPLPKSNSVERIKENSNLYDFDIQNSDLDALEKLNCNYRTCWDPSDVP